MIAVNVLIVPVTSEKELRKTLVSRLAEEIHDISYHQLGHVFGARCYVQPFIGEVTWFLFVIVFKNSSIFRGYCMEVTPEELKARAQLVQTIRVSICILS